MPSEKQREASRANGARSRGPVTTQGKRTSSRNSARHNLLARTVVLEEEAMDRFLDLLRSLMDEHQPRTVTEVSLVETMAVARWRQARVWGVQKVALDRDMALQNPAVGSAPVRALFALVGSPGSQGPTSEVAASQQLLLRYEVAYDRQYARALSRLLELQARPLRPESTPYFPDSPFGQTWDDPPPPDDDAPDEGIAQPHEGKIAAAERTQEVIEIEAPGAAPQLEAPPDELPRRSLHLVVPPPAATCQRKQNPHGRVCLRPRFISPPEIPTRTPAPGSARWSASPRWTRTTSPILRP